MASFDFSVLFSISILSFGAVYIYYKRVTGNNEESDMDDIEMEGTQRTRIRHENGL